MAIGVTREHHRSDHRSEKPVTQTTHQIERLMYTLARIAFNAGVMAQADYRQQGVHPDERADFLGKRFDSLCRSQGLKNE